MTSAKKPTGRKQARKGDGSIYWDEKNQCYVGSISLGTKPDGTRNRPSVRGATQKEVRAKLKELKDDFDDGIELGDKYSVEDAVRDFLKSGVRGLGDATIDELRMHSEKWIIPHLGQAKLKQLKAEDVDAWLEKMIEVLSTSSIKRRLGTLRRVIKFAESRNRVRRNVAALVAPPKGKEGRPSKALTLEQGKALLRASRGKPIHAYIAMSMFTGVRTEEARPLKWQHTHLNPVKGQICSCGGEHSEDLPPHVEVWRSVRMGADTKTPKSRRTIALPEFVVEILTEHQEQQQKTRADRGWKSEGIVYVFGTRYDTAQQAQVIRDQFRSVVAKAGIRGSWTPRELRHSFVSLMSDSGASEELIADLVGHANTTTTRTIYRHQLRPVITKGAEMLDGAFGKGFLDHE
ncbi:site-specific integrase [Glycomyces luteolus]|uniref:Site-specific integrase n=1 Tax=Glycomyces luteolus TaxID=2670330 RepID=A0A9X3T3B7_9ACTN|nr:site-specific integrase [Glycomyces luteolus]MDA1359815.1 site-specific integrase [Glycomyces luteolus]